MTNFYRLEKNVEFWIRMENLRKTRLMLSMQVFYLGASLLGLILLVHYREIRRVRYGVIMILLLWAEHTVVFAWGRFSLDLVPILAVLFGVGADTWTRHCFARRSVDR